MVTKRNQQSKRNHTMIVVTGANGKFGRGVVEHLLTCLPASEIAVSVRDPKQAV
jgi:NAD(P)H dehydrogenase (quinone)